MCCKKWIAHQPEVHLLAHHYDLTHEWSERFSIFCRVRKRDARAWHGWGRLGMARAYLRGGWATHTQPDRHSVIVV